MLLSIEDQFAGIQQTLEEVVIPEISSLYVRGQVYAVMEILNQMQNFIEFRSDLLKEEVDRTREVLNNIGTALGSLGPEVQEAIKDFVRSKQELEAARPGSGKELMELRDRTNRLLELGQELFHRARGTMAREERERVEGLLKSHLGQISRRNLKLLRPTLLKKISRGGDEGK